MKSLFFFCFFFNPMPNGSVLVRCYLCVCTVLLFFHIQHNPPEINCLREIKMCREEEEEASGMVEPRVVIMTMSMCWYNYSYTHITLWHVKKYPQLFFFSLVRGCVTDCNNFLYSFCVQCINGILYNIAFNIY